MHRRGETPAQGCEETTKGKKVQFARITNSGVVRLAELVPLEQFPEVIAATAPSLKTLLIKSFLKALARRAGEVNAWTYRRLMGRCLDAAQVQFDAIEARFLELLIEEQALGDSINAFLKATRGRIEKQKQRLNADLDSIAKSATTLISPSEVVSPDQPRRPQLPQWQRVATTNPEIDFQKNVSEELVFCWQDATTDEARAALERALFNVGVERLAAPGDIIAFDGIAHYTEDEVVEGQAVEVIQPAWQLSTPRGTSLLARARVIKSSRPLPTGEPTRKDGVGADQAIKPAPAPDPPVPFSGGTTP